MIFADADFYIGLYNHGDEHHQKCKSFIEKISDEIVTSLDVIDEVSTKLSYYLSKDIADKFLIRIEKEKVHLVYPDANLFLKAKDIFRSQSSKKVSFTDCINMAIARSLDITTFLSFDKVYEKNGFTLFS